MTDSTEPQQMLGLLEPYAGHKNPKVRGKAGGAVAAAVAQMQVSGRRGPCTAVGQDSAWTLAWAHAGRLAGLAAYPALRLSLPPVAAGGGRLWPAAPAAAIWPADNRQHPRRARRGQTAGGPPERGVRRCGSAAAARCAGACRSRAARVLCGELGQSCGALCLLLRSRCSEPCRGL